MPKEEILRIVNKLTTVLEEWENNGRPTDVPAGLTKADLIDLRTRLRQLLDKD